MWEVPWEQISVWDIVRLAITGFRVIFGKKPKEIEMQNRTGWSVRIQLRGARLDQLLRWQPDAERDHWYVALEAGTEASAREEFAKQQSEHTRAKLLDPDGEIVEEWPPA